MSDGGGELVEVRLVNLSLAAYQDSSEHHDELFREFALILSRHPSSGHEVLGRLLGLMEDLTVRFSAFTSTPRQELLTALDRGDASIDLTYQVPAAVRQACLDLAQLLEEADEYCRQGELLTLAPPPDAVAFRDWYLGEFVAQIDGRAPTPWPGSA